MIKFFFTFVVSALRNAVYRNVAFRSAAYRNAVYRNVVYRSASVSLTLSFTLTFTFFSLCAFAQRDCGLWLNEVPLVADTAANSLYATIEPRVGRALKGTLRWDENRFSSVQLNDAVLENGKRGAYMDIRLIIKMVEVLNVDLVEFAYKEKDYRDLVDKANGIDRG